MIPLSIRTATDVYADAAKCEITRHWVEHPGLEEISKSIRALDRSLCEDVDGDFWRRALGPVRRTAFALCSIPLPSTRIAELSGLNWSELNRLARLCKQAYPDSHERFAHLLASLERALAEESNPLVGPLKELHLQYGELRVLLRDSYRQMNKPLADFFARTMALRNAKLVSIAQLRGGHYCPVLVAIGPSSWFPEHVFAAPRAPFIHLVTYRWFRDTWKPGAVLLHDSADEQGRSTSHGTGKMPSIAGSASLPERQDFDPKDLLPPAPVFRQIHFGDGSASDGVQEVVPARLCHLNGGRGVLVAAEDGATSLVIDTREIGRATVRRVPVEELEAGLYLLLRTSGGGDFIAPLADQILGPLAPTRRAQQAEWKNRLINRAVENYGALSRGQLATLICRNLRAQGFNEARAENVLYWMSSKCIRPLRDEHFMAILKFAELDPRNQEFLSAMNEIRRAHHKAGQAIRRMLLQRISEASLDELERDGEMTFELGDRDGGTLSAYQIIDVLPETWEVPGDRIGVLLDAED